MSEHLGSDETFDALSRMVRALHGDAELAEWFRGLESFSSVDRRNEIYRMREDLLARDPSVPEEIVVPLTLLADDQVFEAAHQAFQAL